MSLMDRHIEVLGKLMEAGQFPGRKPNLQMRGSAMTALVFLCGVPITMLPRLTRAHWRPAGRDVIVLDPEGQYDERRGIKARTIPLVGTAKVVVERYMAAYGSAAPETPILLSEDGQGPLAFNALKVAFENGAKRAGCPGLKLGSVRALFITLLETANTDRSGIAEYITGQDRTAQAPMGYSLENPPPESAMRALMERALPFAKPWRLLIHAPSGRGPKVEKPTGYAKRT